MAAVLYTGVSVKGQEQCHRKMEEGYTGMKGGTVTDGGAHESIVYFFAVISSFGRCSEAPSTCTEGMVTPA